MAKCTGMRCPMQVGYKVDECNHKDCQYRTEPITNADRIRAMSDIEIAKLFVNAVADGCPPKMEWDCAKDEDGWDACDACWCKWLKQPAEGE